MSNNIYSELWDGRGCYNVEKTGEKYECIELVCVLGGEKVGKTTLAMKLVGMEPQPMQVPRGPIVRKLEDRNQNFEYHLLPPINNEVGEKISQDNIFDMFVCMFKDSTSFGQLYEFL